MTSRQTRARAWASLRLDTRPSRRTTTGVVRMGRTPEPSPEEATCSRTTSMLKEVLTNRGLNLEGALASRRMTMGTNPPRPTVGAAGAPRSSSKKMEMRRITRMKRPEASPTLRQASPEAAARMKMMTTRMTRRMRKTRPRWRQSPRISATLPMLLQLQRQAMKILHPTGRKREATKEALRMMTRATTQRPRAVTAPKPPKRRHGRTSRPTTRTRLMEKTLPRRTTMIMRMRIKRTRGMEKRRKQVRNQKRRATRKRRKTNGRLCNDLKPEVLMSSSPMTRARVAKSQEVKPAVQRRTMKPTVTRAMSSRTDSA
mmetsp:Transcript_3893/g.9435  ORF Transcript_3893/g.9435 Transcript_3893/m.9435 type:complete len:314 (+) Transcript_3893:1262-2203(+)